jgi:branched-chain amino acid transport system permease protein
MTTMAQPTRAPWMRAGLWVIGLAVLVYLPTVLTQRAIFGFHLSNMQLLNLGLTQINLMLISMLGALSLNYLTGCAGLISIGHAAFYASGAMAAAIFGTQLGWPFPLVLLAAAGVGAIVGRLRASRRYECAGSTSCSQRWLSTMS